MENPMDVRRRVGYLSEANPLYESLGVWESLTLFARLREIPENRIAPRIREAAEQCSLLDVMSKDVGELSKGYRQRLGLALAILHDPQILILDEPTSALDPNQQKEVRDLILRLKEKKTVLLSTHILPEAQRICNRILIIHQGTIVAQGTMDELQQRMTGGQRFYVRLKGPADQVAPRLRDLPGIREVEPQDEQEPGCPGFLVSSTEDPREALGRMASETGWPLMELHRPVTALDDIFRQFTETK